MTIKRRGTKKPSLFQHLYAYFLGIELSSSLWKGSFTAVDKKTKKKGVMRCLCLYIAPLYEEIKRKHDCFAVRDDKNKWALFSEYGEILLDFEYESISHSINPDLFYAHKEGFVALFSASKRKFVFSLEDEWARLRVEDSYVFATKGAYEALYNLAGKEILSLDLCLMQINRFVLNKMKTSYFLVKKGYCLSGLADEKGIVIEPLYGRIEDITGSFAIVSDGRGKFGVVEIGTSEEVYPLEYKRIGVIRRETSEHYSELEFVSMQGDSKRVVIYYDLEEEISDVDAVEKELFAEEEEKVDTQVLQEKTFLGFPKRMVSEKHFLYLLSLKKDRKIWKLLRKDRVPSLSLETRKSILSHGNNQIIALMLNKFDISDEEMEFVLRRYLEKRWNHGGIKFFVEKHLEELGIRYSFALQKAYLKMLCSFNEDTEVLKAFRVLHKNVSKIELFKLKSSGIIDIEENGMLMFPSVTLSEAISLASELAEFGSEEMLEKVKKFDNPELLLLFERSVQIGQNFLEENN